MIIFFMCKNNFIFLFFFLFSTLLGAREPLLSTLVTIVSNEVHEFKNGNYKYICTPYGIYTLEELYRNAEKDSMCRKSIRSFYKKRPDLFNYSHQKFNTFQSYSMVFKNQKCLVHVAGEKSYSEFLLEEGLAMKVPTKLDIEYDFLFLKVQREAKREKKGLWSVNIAKECASSIDAK